MKKVHQLVVFLSLVSPLSCVGSETTKASTARFLVKIAIQKLAPHSEVSFTLFEPIKDRASLQPIENHPISPLGEKILQLHGVSPLGTPEPKKTSNLHNTPALDHGVSPYGESRTPSPVRPSK